MVHIVLDLTSLTYEPTSRERSTLPAETCDICLDRSKNCAPSSFTSEDEDDKPLVQSTSRQENVNLPQKAIFLNRCEEEKDLQFGETHLQHRNKMCQGIRVSDLKKSECWAKIKMVKALRKIINKLLDERNWRDHLNYHMSTSQFKKNDLFGPSKEYLQSLPACVQYMPIL